MGLYPVATAGSDWASLMSTLFPGPSLIPMGLPSNLQGPVILLQCSPDPKGPILSRCTPAAVSSCADHPRLGTQGLVLGQLGCRLCCTILHHQGYLCRPSYRLLAPCVSIAAMAMKPAIYVKKLHCLPRQYLVGTREARLCMNGRCNPQRCSKEISSTLGHGAELLPGVGGQVVKPTTILLYHRQFDCASLSVSSHLERKTWVSETARTTGKSLTTCCPWLTASRQLL